MKLRPPGLPDPKSLQALLPQTGLQYNMWYLFRMYSSMLPAFLHRNLPHKRQVLSHPLNASDRTKDRMLLYCRLQTLPYFSVPVQGHQSPQPIPPPSRGAVPDNRPDIHYPTVRQFRS